MSNPLVVANWKMNKTPAESVELVQAIQDRLSGNEVADIVLCPSFPALHPVSEILDTNKVMLGAQDGHFADQGTYTGAVSMSQIRNLIDYVMVGHSERRQYFGDNNEIVARKMQAALRNELTPVLCIGENATERHQGETARVIHDQLHMDLVMLTSQDVQKVVITYEPLWAISQGDGHGETASPEQIKHAVAHIRETIEGLHGAKAARAVRVLYGGSVNADNASGYMKIDGINGFLVGGASLHPEEFITIATVSGENGSEKEESQEEK